MSRGSGGGGPAAAGGRRATDLREFEDLWMPNGWGGPHRAYLEARRGERGLVVSTSPAPSANGAGYNGGQPDLSRIERWPGQTKRSRGCCGSTPELTEITAGRGVPGPGIMRRRPVRLRCWADDISQLDVKACGRFPASSPRSRPSPRIPGHRSSGRSRSCARRYRPTSSELTGARPRAETRPASSARLGARWSRRPGGGDQGAWRGLAGFAPERVASGRRGPRAGAP